MHCAHTANCVERNAAHRFRRVVSIPCCTCTAFCVQRNAACASGELYPYHFAHARRSAFSVPQCIASQDLYPYWEYAHDGIAFMKTMLKNRSFWSGPVVDVSRCPPIAPPTKRSQNQYVIAQARIHAKNTHMHGTKSYQHGTIFRDHVQLQTACAHPVRNALCQSTHCKGLRATRQMCRAAC